MPKGHPVALVRRSAYPISVLCVDQRLIIIGVESGRRLYLNAEPLSRAELARRLDRIFFTRAERVAYVLGGPNVSFGEVADAIGIVRAVVPNVGLLTASTVPTNREPLLKGSLPMKTDWN
jgi:biopolymer transport protein ExbD